MAEEESMEEREVEQDSTETLRLPVCYPGGCVSFNRIRFTCIRGRLLGQTQTNGKLADEIPIYDPREPQQYHQLIKNMRERAYRNALEAVLGEESQTLIRQITQNQTTLVDFFEKVEEEHSLLKQYADGRQRSSIKHYIRLADQALQKIPYIEIGKLCPYEKPPEKVNTSKRWRKKC